MKKKNLAWRQKGFKISLPRRRREGPQKSGGTLCHSRRSSKARGPKRWSEKNQIKLLLTNFVQWDTHDVFSPFVLGTFLNSKQRLSSNDYCALWWWDVKNEADRNTIFTQLQQRREVDWTELSRLLDKHDDFFYFEKDYCLSFSF